MTVGALVVTGAGPGVFPDSPAAIAFIVVDEGGLAAGFVVPLVGAIGFLLHFHGPSDQGARYGLLACVERDRGLAGAYASSRRGSRIAPVGGGYIDNFVKPQNEVLDLDVGGMIAVIGPTGAGKSAILDGVQVVITGNNGNFIDPNPSAGEKSDRTVLSYCLGQVSDFDRGAPKRERCETILALTFRDTATDGPLTIGLLLHADHSERTESSRALFIARDYAFSFEDFIERDEDVDEFVVSHDEIIARLKKSRGKALTLHARSTQFVAEYLAAMRPRSSPDARLFLRSFNNAVLAREIRDPTDFVRRFVLEADPLNVERIRSSIETWRSMEKRAEELEMEIRDVRLVRSRFATWARQTLQSQTEEYIASASERMRLEFEIRELEKEKERADQENASLNRLIVNHTSVVAENRDQVIRKLDGHLERQHPSKAP